MSVMANNTPIITTVQNTGTKEQTPREVDGNPRANILPIIMNKARHDKRKEVQARLDFGGNYKKTYRGRAGSALGTTSKAGNTLVVKVLPTVWAVSAGAGTAPAVARDPMETPTLPIGHEASTEITPAAEVAPTKWYKPTNDEDLAVPWSCEEVDPFTPQIRNFTSSRKTRMPNNVKTYNGTVDLEDHVKNFQAAVQVERWAMPKWCDMFNSTLIGTARVWFDELPSKGIDNYKDLKAAFLAYFMQQKKYVKDPVEIHNIKHKDGETIEDFIKHFKVETGRIKGAPECMRISGFMNGVNNPELIKRLNENVPKTMEEVMSITTAFVRGETAAASKKKIHTPWRSQDQPKWHALERRSNFQTKFRPPPPMVTPVEKRSSNKFCEFHNDKGYSTDEYVQLKKQIEELVRAGKLSYFIKEISREITFPPLAASNGTEGPLVIEAEIGRHTVHHMYVDGGSSEEVLHEH
ncbi:reverse transcriptase domain-containing protein [Tanacetum coccineum]